MRLTFPQFRRSSILGIDINDLSIKLAELKKTYRGYELAAYANVDLPETAIVQKEIKDALTVSACLKEAIALSRSHARYGAIALPDSQVMAKIISIKKSSSELEIEEQVMFEAIKHIPYPLDEVRIDYRLMPHSDENSESIPVFLSAVRFETIDSYLGVLQHASIIPHSVGVESFVMSQAYEYFISEFKQAKSVAIFDIGNTRATLAIYHDGFPIFRQTEALEAVFLSDKAFQQQHKLCYSLDLNHAGQNEQLKNNLLDYLKQSIKLYSSLPDNRTIEHIVLTGETTMLKSWNISLTNKMEHNLILANPIHKLKLNKNIDATQVERVSSGLMMAIGLALRD